MVTAVDPFRFIPNIVTSKYLQQQLTCNPSFIGLRWAGAYVYDEFSSLFDFDISFQ